jgi:hypothetical protein
MMLSSPRVFVLLPHRPRILRLSIAKVSIEEIKQRACDDLEYFIRLVSPRRALGQCHVDLIRWWTRPDGKSHQLVLLPRDHQKSALAAFRVAWEITKNPAIRVLYISSTSLLARKQLKLIKDILTDEIYRRYWPEMIHKDETQREKWTEGEIAVDHPLRRQRMVRDPTIFTAGLTTNITGLHCDLAVLDDVVVEGNAYTDEGRDQVRNQAGYLASITGTQAKLWAVGTRYHPKDLYDDFMQQVVEIRGEDGSVTRSYNLYEVWEQKVEDRGDGTGNFLWPRMKTKFGEWYGFNVEELAIKKAQYPDQTRFRAQYYNDPNDLSTATITPDMFQYFNPKALRQEGYRWFYKDRPLNVFAAIDFAYSLAKRSDYTAIVVVGVDTFNNYYVLDVDRFKTLQISEYYDRILRLYTKWQFRKLRMETTAAQVVMVKDLKENYIRANGLALSIDEFRPTRHLGSKEERIEAVLQPRYANRQVWHYSGGHCTLLEEELVMAKPPHDDIKDCLASAIDSSVPPATHAMRPKAMQLGSLAHPRFGGIG